MQMCLSVHDSKRTQRPRLAECLFVNSCKHPFSHPSTTARIDAVWTANGAVVGPQQILELCAIFVRLPGIAVQNYGSSVCVRILLNEGVSQPAQHDDTGRNLPGAYEWQMSDYTLASNQTEMKWRIGKSANLRLLAVIMGK